MPANLLIFDSEYVAELTSGLNRACELMAEAVSSLKSASNHDGWKCKERTRILESFENLNTRLGRLDNGVNETTRILGGRVAEFEALERQYESQADLLSDDLTNNHGYSGTVHTDTIPPEPVEPISPSTPAGSGGNDSGSGGAIGAAGAAGGAGAAVRPGQGGHGGHGGGGAGFVPGGMRPGNPGGHEGHGGPAGGGSMNVNLPVTHIPDAPDAAARGIKDTQQVAEIAVTTVVQTMTQVITGGGSASFTSSSSMDFRAAAPSLAEAYNAGRAIFENGSAIMSSPTQSHTTERLAMAAGLVSLAGSGAAGLAVFGQAAGGLVGMAGSGAHVTASGSFSASGSAQVHSGNVSASANFTNNASFLIDALPDSAGELKQVLGVLSGQSTGAAVSSASASSGSGMSFFEKIVAEFKKAAEGNFSSSAGTSSANTSSPVTEFLGSYVMG